MVRKFTLAAVAALTLAFAGTAHADTETGTARRYDAKLASAPEKDSMGIALVPVRVAANCGVDKSADVEPIGKKQRLGIGIFSPTGASGLSSSTGVSMFYSTIAKRTKNADVVLTLGLTGFSVSDKSSSISASVLLMPFLVEYQYRFGNGLYAGPALGYNQVLADATSGDTTLSVTGSSLAYGVTLGWESKAFYTELRYLGSDKSGDAGFVFLLGGKF